MSRHHRKLDRRRWERVRLECLDRDGWRCQRCGAYGKECDHVVPLDRSHYERRDRMAFAMAESGDATARDALLRIVQRDPDAEKRRRAESLLRQLAASAPQADGGGSLGAST